LLEEEKKVPPYNPNEKSVEHKTFCQSKSKFTKAMTLIGINAEHILK
jgi:hypothetical protein